MSWDYEHEFVPGDHGDRGGATAVGEDSEGSEGGEGDERRCGGDGGYGGECNAREGLSGFGEAGAVVDEQVLIECLSL